MDGVENGLRSVAERVHARHGALLDKLRHGPRAGGLVHSGGVEGDAHAAHGGIGQRRHLERDPDAPARRGQGNMGVTIDMRTPGIVAQDNGIGLRAVQQPQAHARIGRVKQRALPLDHIPMVWCRRRREQLGRTGDEVRDHGVDGKAAPADQQACLTGGTEIGVPARSTHIAFKRERCVFLADRAIGADGQQSAPASPRPGADRQGDARGKVPDIVDPAAQCGGPRRDLGAVHQPVMKARREIEPGIERAEQYRQPIVGYPAAERRDADHQRPCTRGRSLGDGKGGKVDRHAAVWQTNLRHTPFAAPVQEPQCGLRIETIRYVANKQRIGTRDVEPGVEGSLLPLMCFHDPTKADDVAADNMTPSRTGQAALSFGVAAELFDLIGTADFLPSLFSTITRHVACDGGCIMQYFEDRKPIYLYHKPSPTRTVQVDAYFEGPYVLDPFFQLHMAQGAGEGVYWLGDISGDDFTSSEYYQAFYSKTDAFDELDLHIDDRSGRRISMFLVRSRQSGRFTRADVEALREVLPLVRASLLKHLSIAGGDLIARPPEDTWHAKLLVTFRLFASSCLTSREREIVIFMLNGYSAALTGEKLGISEGTVRNHRKAVHRKLDIGSQAELFALFLGCIPFADPRKAADPLIAYEASPFRTALPSLEEPLAH